jgi:hypothetical protein
LLRSIIFESICTSSSVQNFLPRALTDVAADGGGGGGGDRVLGGCKGGGGL